MIAIHAVRKIAADLMEYGKVLRPGLSLGGATVNRDLARYFDLAVDRGVAVTDIVEAGPAHEAGLRLGDVIIGLDGEAVTTMGELRYRLRMLRPGESGWSAAREWERREDRSGDPPPSPLNVCAFSELSARSDPSDSDAPASPRRTFMAACELDHGMRVDMGAEVDVPEGGAKCVTANQRPYAVFKVGGVLYCLDNRCTHVGGALYEGTVDAFVVTCRWHGSRFDIRSGRVVGAPARTRSGPSR